MCTTLSAFSLEGDKVAVVASDGSRLEARKEMLMEQSFVMKAMPGDAMEQHTNETVLPDVSLESLRLILFNMH